MRKANSPNKHPNPKGAKIAKSNFEIEVNISM